MVFFKSLKRLFSKSKPKSRLKKKPKTESTARHIIVDHIDNDLNIAARRGDILAVQRLLTHSATTKTPEKHQQRIIKAFFAAANSNQADVVVMLIKEYQVAPDVENSDGSTALKLAVEAGHGKMTRVLIESGADPFRGDLSPYDRANMLWTKEALEMLKDKIEQVRPDMVEKLGRPRKKEDEGKKVPGKEENEHRDRDGEQIWPDRVFIRKGEREYMPPSDPSYWY